MRTITINRTIPSFSVTKGTTQNKLVQGDTRPITFSVPSYTWASYNWSISGAGSFSGPTNTNQATVIPNCYNGTVTCTMSAGGKTQSASYSLVFLPEDPNNPVTISGSSTLICSGSNHTYTISNLPINATSQWSVNSNLSIVSQNNTSVTVRSATGAVGTGVITLVYTTIVNQQVSKTKSMWVGAPNNLTISGPPIILQNKTGQYTIGEAQSQGINTYSWEATGGLFPSGSTTSSTFKAQGRGCGDSDITCTASNSCGSSYTSRTIEVVCVAGYAMSPNPVSTNLTIEQIAPGEVVSATLLEPEEVVVSEQTKSLVNDNSYTIEIWHEGKGKLKTIKSKNKKEIIDISALKKGIYLVQIITPYSIYKEKFVKE